MSSISFEHLQLDEDATNTLESTNPQFESNAAPDRAQEESSNNKRISTYTGYAAALLIAAGATFYPYLRNEIQADEPIAVDASKGDLDFLATPTPKPTPRYPIQPIGEVYELNPVPNRYFYEGEFGEGGTKYKFVIPHIFVDGKIDNQFILDMETAISVINSASNSETINSLLNTELNVLYTISEVGVGTEYGISVYSSPESNFRYQGLRVISIPFQDIDRYQPNQRTLLVDIIHSYLFFAFNTAQYEGVEPDDIGKIWVHINSSLLRGDTYQEYRYGLGSNPPMFTYEEYSALLAIFARYGPEL